MREISSDSMQSRLMFSASEVGQGLPVIGVFAGGFEPVCGAGGGATFGGAAGGVDQG